MTHHAAVWHGAPCQVRLSATTNRSQGSLSASPPPTVLGDVCDRCLALLPVGASSSLVLTGTLPAVWETVAARGPHAAGLEDAQFAVDEGPGVCAARTGSPVLADDLGRPEATAHWPRFSPLAVGLGVLAALAVPVLAGTVRIGVLTAWATVPGMPPRALPAMNVLAASATSLVLSDPLIDFARPGRVSAERARVHQATGMVMVQHRIGADQALQRLRDYATSHNLPLPQVSDDVVRRRLVLPHEQGH